jgi:hypothetical protein
MLFASYVTVKVRASHRLDTVSYEASETTTEYSARRISVSTPASLRDLRRSLENLVPALDLDGLPDPAAEAAGWDALRRGAEAAALYGLCRVATNDPGRLMRLAGSGTDSVSYLLGSLTIQAQLFRYDPATMVHFPLRLEMHAGRRGGTVLTFEQPGVQLAGFGINKVTQAGFELDRLLGDLLEAMDLPRPAALRR